MTLTTSATEAEAQRPGDARYRCEACGRFTPELTWMCDRRECKNKIKELAWSAR